MGARSGSSPDAAVTPRSELWLGIRRISPVLLGVVPFGLISGLTAVQAGLSAGEALGMSAIVFAGASQLAAVQLLSAGAPAWVILLTAAVINLRFTMYSASLAAYLKHLPAPWKAASAYLMTDQAYAVSVTHFADQPERPHRRWFYLGGAALMWAAWQLSTVAGVFVGASVPPAWGLSFAIPLTFMALVFPVVRDRPAAAAALSAGAVAVAAEPLSFNLGLVLAALCGILVGLFVEARA